jgi:hypothetical protein
MERPIPKRIGDSENSSPTLGEGQVAGTIANPPLEDRFQQFAWRG